MAAAAVVKGVEEEVGEGEGEEGGEGDGEASIEVGVSAIDHRGCSGSGGRRGEEEEDAAAHG